MAEAGAISESTAFAASAPARAQRAQELDHLTAAALRALAGDTRLDYRNLRAYRHGRPILWLAPHLAWDDEDGLLARRATADACALRERETAWPVHLRFAPQAPLARMLYEWFETFRVESLAPACWPGTRHNIQSNFRAWSGRFHDSTLTETRLGLLLFAIVQFVHFRLQDVLPDEPHADRMMGTLRSVMPRLGPALREMVWNRRTPEQFAPAARTLALQIAALVDDVIDQAPAAATERPLGRDAFHIPIDFEADGDAGFPLVAHEARAADSAAGAGYRAFTCEFDREAAASALVRGALLDDYTARTATRLARAHLPLRRLARELERELIHLEPTSWSFDEEAGRIDARHLTRLVTSPMERRLFRQPLRTPVTDAALTLLIDCTGSMRQHAEALATFATGLNRIAALAHVPLEILGFSTSSWNGGRSRTRWVRQRQPADPGRVADRLHLVFQSFSTRPAAARRQISALLKPELYREGLDGEAVEWAASRLLRHAARRRILWVVSDGCPNETATSQLNAPHYLERHLHGTIERAARDGVEIMGIGLGLDLSPFYRVNLPVDADALVSTRTFIAIWQRIRAARARPPR